MRNNRTYSLIVAAALCFAACGQDTAGSANSGPTVNNAQTGDVGDDTNNGGETGDVGGEDLTDPDGGVCDNECSTAGAARCDGDERHECVEDASGCLSWETVETCSGELFCSAGQCVSQCQDACSTMGARRCEGGGSGSVAECQVDPNGCLAWTGVQDCIGVETCSNGECAAECADECAAVNDRTCDGDGYKLCGNFDADPCLDWGDVVPCNDDATCSNGYCAVECTDECSTPGVDECVVGTDARHTCGDFDADPCLEWSTPVSCGADETCSGGACVFDDPCAGVTCNMPPADTCTDANTARTHGAGTCNATGGCDYGFVDTHCPDGCQNGACVAPTCSGVACDSPPADTCASSSDLTRYFPLGACDSNDACEYQSTTIVCSEGCFQGACITGSWETEIPPLGAGSATSLDVVFDATGAPHFAYCDQHPGDVTYRWRDASGWHEELVDPALGSGCEVAIGLDAQGRPMIAYHDPTNGHLRFGRKEAGTWSLDLIATMGTVGLAPSVSTNPAGEAVVAYRDETNDELKLATLSNGSWTSETVGPWTGGADAITAMRWSRTGDLHVLAGSSRSVAHPHNPFDQPELFLHTKSGGNWQTVTLHEDAFTSRDGIALAPNGDVVVQAGVVHPAGTNDEVVVIWSDGTQVLDQQQVRSVGNLLRTKPVGIFNTDTMLEALMNDPLHYRFDDHDYWVQRASTPVDAQGGILRVSWTLGDDVYRLLHHGWRITTPAPCTPECSGRSCGNDGCGGVCGTCGSGESCDPNGQCSIWNYETPDAWLDEAMLAKGNDELHTFGFDSESGGLMYSTNITGDWSSVSTGVDAAGSKNDYDGEAVAVDSSGQIHIATIQRRPTHFNAWDKVEVFSQGPMGWTSTIADEFFQGGEPVAFAIDDNDVWHFALSERRYPNYNGSQLAYVRYENGMGTKEVITTPVDSFNRGNGTASQVRLVVDSAGNAHILWVQRLTYTSQVSLRYATNASGTWVDTAVLDPFQTSTTAFAIDDTGKLHASYLSSGSSPFQYGTYDSGTGMWSWEDGPLNYWDQFGLDPAGTPFFIDGVFDGIELHRRAGPGNWTAETIPVYGWGTPIRLMFDDASNLHFIYRAGGGNANYQIRHAWK